MRYCLFWIEHTTENQLQSEQQQIHTYNAYRDASGAVLLSGLRLSEAHHTDGRVREHHCGHGVVVHVRVFHTAEEPVNMSCIL